MDHLTSFETVLVIASIVCYAYGIYKFVKLIINRYGRND